MKHVSPPTATSHPRGWHTDHSHQRKLKSYAVETQWYREFANRCGESCRVPECLAVEVCGDEVTMVLEDLWESGTYWHLQTRPDELAVLALEDPALYAADGEN